jgi:hypothetical protein
MPTEEFYTGPEIAEMMGSPVVYSYASDGRVQVEKCALIGFGLNIREALADRGKKFSQMVALQKAVGGNG